MAAQQAPIQVDVVGIVRAVLASHDSREEATNALLLRARSDGDFREALIYRYQPNLVAELCAMAIRMEGGAARGGARRAARGDVDGALLSRIGAIKANLLLWTLPSGIKIQRATREDLLEAVDHHEEARRAHSRAITFYRSVISRLGAGQIVGDVVSDEELATLLETSQR